MCIRSEFPTFSSLQGHASASSVKRLTKHDNVFRNSQLNSTEQVYGNAKHYFFRNQITVPKTFILPN